MNSTSTTRSTRPSYSQRRELFTLLLFSILVAASWLWLPGLVRRGWHGSDPGNLTRTLLSLPSLVGVSFASVQAAAVGFFLGLLALMLFDEKKRVQAVLLWTGVAGLGIAFLVTDFIPRIFTGPLVAHLPWLGAGLVAAVPTCLPRSSWSALVDHNRAMSWEFRRAATTLSLLVLVSVAAMVLEANVTYPAVRVGLDGVAFEPRWFFDVDWASLAWDSALAGVFGVALGRFMAYDRESTVFAVGPSEAGKTYFSVGAFLEESTRANGRAGDPSQELVAKVNKVAGRAGSEASPSWSLDSTDTGTAERLSFTLEDGRYFPENLSVETLDYAGENLAGLARLLDDPELTPATLEQADLPDRANLDDVLRMHGRVEASDTLLLLLDATSVFPGVASDDDGANRVEGGDLDAFAPLVKEYAGDKRLVFVVTKADVLDEEYAEEVGIDIYDRRYLDEFASQLRYRLSDHPVVGRYLADANASGVYPVYFRTERNEEGTRVPFRPEDGRALAPYGFSRLLEDL